MVSSCAVFGCKSNKAKEPNLHFHRFPSDKNRSKKWLTTCKRKDLQNKSPAYLSNNCTICDLHFTEDQFMNPNRKKLIWCAVPTIFSPFSVPKPGRKPPAVRTPQPEPEETIRPEEPLTTPLQTPQPSAVQSSTVHTSIQTPAVQTSIQTPTVQTPTVQTPTVQTSTVQISTVQTSSPTSTVQTSTSQVPTVKVGHDHAYSKADQVSSQRASQDKSVDSMFLVNKIVELQSKLAEKESVQVPQDMMSVDNIINAAVTIGLNPVAAAFLKGQLRNCNKKGSGGHRWTVQDKGAALGIYFRSESAYKLLSTIFTMPSPSTLQRFVCDLPGMIGFNEDVMSVLAIKAKSLSGVGKHCILTFQEMSLRKELTYNAETDEINGIVKLPCQRLIPCNQVLVFMANGIASNWKQPLAYFFGENTAPTDVVRMNLLHMLASMYHAELKPIAVVCDRETCDPSLFTSLGVTEENPYFEFESEIIYALYDTPKIIKDIRNTLIKGDIHFDIDKTASWEDIIDFYKADRSLPVRLAPKLTSHHIHLQPSTPMKVSMAAEVFSDSVYVGMRTLTALSQLDPSADQTAEFLKVVNDIYDLLYASNPAKKKVNAKDLEKLGTLQEKVRLWFSNEMVPECFLALKLNLNSIALMANSLLTEANFKYVLTGRLTQDCLDDFCDQVKSKVGERNPTVVEFEDAFRLLTTSMMLDPITSGNCEYNSDELLSSISLLSQASKSGTKRKIGQTSNEKSAKTAKVSLCPLVEKIDDFQPTDVDCNIVSYIGCYLLQRIKVATQCNGCLDLVSDRTDIIQEKWLSQDYPANCSLAIPNISFINFLLQAEHIFLEEIAEIRNKKGILAHLQDSVEKAVPLGQLKQCSVHENPDFVRSLLNIYLRCRLVCYLKLHTSQINAGDDGNKKVEIEIENFVESVETVNHILISDTAVLTLTDIQK